MSEDKNTSCCPDDNNASGCCCGGDSAKKSPLMKIVFIVIIGAALSIVIFKLSAKSASDSTGKAKTEQCCPAGKDSVSAGKPCCAK